jgi:uncharacterized protein YkwD
MNGTDTMLVGGTQLPIAGAGGGQQAITLQANGSSQYAGAAPGGTAVAAANGVGRASDLTQARREQLMAGAPPANLLEQAWVSVVSSAYAGLVQLIRQAVAQSVQTVAGAGGSEDHALEQQVLALVNVERTKGGLAPLVYDGRLDLASERHNQQQALTGRMAHDGIGDGTPGERIRATGVTTNWGENVATGQLSAEQVVREWMASPGHRRNIMDPTFRRLGVSYTVGGDGRTYWAQSFGG